jgi:hypothetical protein
MGMLGALLFFWMNLGALIFDSIQYYNTSLPSADPMSTYVGKRGKEPEVERIPRTYVGRALESAAKGRRDRIPAIESYTQKPPKKKKKKTNSNLKLNKEGSYSQLTKN